jgi:hypothetical protein
MPMSYSMYFERRKALDEDCAKTTQEYAQAIARRDDAVAVRDTAEANLDRGTEELRGWRERHLLESTDRVNAAATEVDTATEKRDHAQAKRKDLEGEYTEFEEAAKQGIPPGDVNAPADITSLRERIVESVEQVKDTMETGLMTGGMIAKILTATPDAHEQATPVATIEQIKQEVAREAIALDAHTTQTYEARVNAPPGEIPTEITEHYRKKERDEEREKEHQKELAEGRDKEEEKRDLESQVEAIGHEEHMTDADDLHERNKRSLEEMAESTRHPSIPDPEKSAEVIAKQKQTVANDNEPQHHAMPAADKPVTMPAHAVGSGGMPNPDPPATALAAKSPANDNHPKSPANDNDPNF